MSTRSSSKRGLSTGSILENQSVGSWMKACGPNPNSVWQLGLIARIGHGSLAPKRKKRVEPLTSELPWIGSFVRSFRSIGSGEPNAAERNPTIGSDANPHNAASAPAHACKMNQSRAAPMILSALCSNMALADTSEWAYALRRESRFLPKGCMTKVSIR